MIRELIRSRSGLEVKRPPDSTLGFRAQKGITYPTILQLFKVLLYSMFCNRGWYIGGLVGSPKKSPILLGCILRPLILGKPH